METLRTEILVIGSGFGGAATALRMAEAGFQVVILEKGGDIRPERDFRQTQDPQYLLRFIRSIRSDTISFVYGEGLGGGSGFYEMVSLRAPTLAFDQRGRNGRRLWPAGLDRGTLDPYYAKAERMMHVKQIAPGEIPKSGLAFSLLMKRLGYSVDRVPYSVRGCLGHGFCVAGCTAGAKVTLHDTYLAPAQASGARILTDIEALSVSTLGGDPGAGAAERNMHNLPFRYRVLCAEGSGGNPLTIDAKVVLLGGGTIGTARLLLNSRRGLPMLTGEVGKHIAVNGTVKALALLPENFPDADMFTGRSHPGVISYQFLASHGITISTAKPLPVDAVSYANLVVEGETRTPCWWGEPKVELMKLYRRRALPIFALGLTTPRAELRATRSGSVVPSFHIDGEFREYYRRTLELLHSIYRQNGARLVSVALLDGEGVEYPDIHISTAHMTGSCRMADTPGEGVADA
ncbi:MAG TPA: GMC family oxidoreductase N-terminal domain-containing protein, partial [Bacteroidota bacterium]|nr:GMC family oxidoreductase N-terminal domain-containing protein [Bacteroidota bacterium]